MPDITQLLAAFQQAYRQALEEWARGTPPARMRNNMIQLFPEVNASVRFTPSPRKRRGKKGTKRGHYPIYLQIGEQSYELVPDGRTLRINTVHEYLEDVLGPTADQVNRPAKDKMEAIEALLTPQAESIDELRRRLDNRAVQIFKDMAAVREFCGA